MLGMAVIPPLADKNSKLDKHFAAYLYPDEGLLFRIEEFVGDDFNPVGRSLRDIMNTLGTTAISRSTAGEQAEDGESEDVMLEGARLCAELSADVNITNAQIEYCRAALKWAYRDGWQYSDIRIAFAEAYIDAHDYWWDTSGEPLEVAYAREHAGDVD